MVLEKLNIDLKNPFILDLASQCGVGKSTALTIMASELINKGYSIAFISEEPTNVIAKRLHNLVYIKNGKCRIFKLINGELDIQKIINVGNFDFVLCDGILNNEAKFFETIRTISFKQKVSFLFTIQSKKVIGNVFEGLPTKPIHIADYIVGLTKREPTWFDKIKKYFGFTIKNSIFVLIKNRMGSETKFDYHINFEYINK
jgi:ribosomal protein S13